MSLSLITIYKSLVLIDIEQDYIVKLELSKYHLLIYDQYN
jgi:hypothetical protein